MNLTNIKLKNYRCYKDEASLITGNLSCLIGKNDIGKSTFLDALDTFFNGNIDKGDLSKSSDGNVIEITCTFSGLPESIILDANTPTTAADELILNAEGHLEVKKTFTIGKTISKATYLNCKHPAEENVNDLLTLKNAQLKLRATELGVDLEGIDKKKNPRLREAIRTHLSGYTLSETELKVDGSLDTENNLKSIWSSLNKYLPIYSLFKTDKSIDDKDKDVQDPMKLAVKESLAAENIQDLLTQIEEEVKNNLPKSPRLLSRSLKRLIKA